MYCVHLLTKCKRENSIKNIECNICYIVRAYSYLYAENNVDRFENI